jgi:pyruvate/2-oxoglutarate dehydrogenase complex dihydrolipoamide dehydrogenase (E3) component
VEQQEQAAGGSTDVVAVDAIVIGTGQAIGNVVSAHLGRGGRVVVFEEGLPGGTCLNTGCRPTKAMRASARVAHMARRAADFGVSAGDVSVDIRAVVGRKDAMIDKWRAGIQSWFDTDEGIDYRHERAHLVPLGPDVPAGHHVVEGGDGRRVSAPLVYLNTGTRTTLPPVEGLDGVPWLDNSSILHVDEVPTHLVVLGGNYIGLEFGQMFRRFGAEVTIIERSDRLAHREEPEISAALRGVLEDEGVTVRTGTQAVRVSQTPGAGMVVDLADGERIVGSHLLVAAGRRPNTDDLGLAEVGVAMDERGYVTTDDHFATTVDGIFALGDINGRGAFTHTSYMDGEIAADNLAGGTRSVGDRVITYGIFTDPPVGRVGMTEAEVRAAGIDAAVATYEMADVTRAVLDGERAGFAKILVDRRTDLFLGASIMGPSCDEVVQVVSALIHAGAPCRVLGRMLPIHPTVTEFWPTILKAQHPLQPADDRTPAGGHRAA